MTTQTDNQPLTENQNPQNTAILHDTTVSTQTQPEQPQRNRRWGRISRLPTAARLYINQSLRDGLAYEQIIEQLARDGHADITYDILAHWAKRGYLDWLRDQEKFEQHLLAMDKTQSQKTPATRRNKFRALSELDIAIQLHTAARQFDLEKFCEHLQNKPEVFLRLVQTNALHERNAILRDRNEIELKKIGARKKRATKPKRGGLNSQELTHLDSRMNL